MFTKELKHGRNGSELVASRRKQRFENVASQSKKRSVLDAGRRTR